MTQPTDPLPPELEPEDSPPAQEDSDYFADKAEDKLYGRMR